MLARCACRTLGEALSVSAVYLSLLSLFFGNGNRVCFFLRFKSKEDNEMTSLFQLLRRQIQQSDQWPYVSKFDAILNSSAVVYRRIQDFPPKTRGRVQCVTKGPDEFVLTV